MPFKGINKEKGRKTLRKEYRASAADCRHCSLKEKCCKNARYKQVSHSVDKPHYDKAYKLLNTREGKRKMRLRGATVEPVWGTLLHFRRLKKVYTIGNELANKQVLMASAAYNLKKLMAYKTIKSATNVLKNSIADLKLTVSEHILKLYEIIFLFGIYRTGKTRLILKYI